MYAYTHKGQKVSVLPLERFSKARSDSTRGASGVRSSVPGPRCIYLLCTTEVCSRSLPPPSKYQTHCGLGGFSCDFNRICQFGLFTNPQPEFKKPSHHHFRAVIFFCCAKPSVKHQHEQIQSSVFWRNGKTQVVLSLPTEGQRLSSTYRERQLKWIKRAL